MRVSRRRLNCIVCGASACVGDEKSAAVSARVPRCNSRGARKGIRDASCDLPRLPALSLSTTSQRCCVSSTERRVKLNCGPIYTYTDVCLVWVCVFVCLTLNTHRDRRWDRSAVESWCASASAGTADAAALRASVGNDDGRSLSSLSLPHTIREQYRIIGLRFRHPLPSQPLSKYHVVINVGALAFANPVPGSQSRTTGILRNTHN